MDQTITQWINSFAGQNTILDGLMTVASEAGIPLMIVLVAVQWWSRTDRLHVRHICISAGLSFMLGLLINQVILLFVQRVRPYDAGVSHLILAPSSDWSFPSDHATSAIAIVAACLLHGLGRRAAAFGVLAVVICWSRVFVGTHYVTDVLGGGLTGMVAAAVVWRLYREGTRVDRLLTGIL